MTDWLREAATIGDRFVAEALWSDDRCTWIQRDLQEPDDPVGKGPIARTLDPTLYSGLAGVGVFLGQLAVYTGSSDHANAALGAIRRALDDVELALDLAPRHGYRGPASPGFYSGGIGILWATGEVARILNDDEVLQRTRTLRAKLIEAQPVSTGSRDVMGGSAGVIPVLLEWAAKGGEDAAPALAYAELLGQELLESAIRDGDSVSWPFVSRTGDGTPLTGYSHGNAGYAVALAKLFEATGNEEYYAAAAGALVYEQLNFSDEHQNWYDLREVDGKAGPPSTMTAWCHGAPGIGIARRLSLNVLGDPAAHNDLRIAAATTRAFLERRLDVPDLPATYCHGVVGNLDCLLFMGDPEHYAADVQMAISAMTHRAKLYGTDARQAWSHPFLEWPIGRPGYDDLSLLKGLAGTGHFLLRLHSGFAVPTALVAGGSLLEQPTRQPLPEATEATAPGVADALEART